MSAHGQFQMSIDRGISQQPALLHRGTTEPPLAGTSQHALLAVAQHSGRSPTSRPSEAEDFPDNEAVGGMTGTLTTVDVPETWGACREALEERLGTRVLHFDDPDIH